MGVQFCQLSKNTNMVPEIVITSPAFEPDNDDLPSIFVTTYVTDDFIDDNRTINNYFDDNRTINNYFDDNRTINEGYLYPPEVYLLADSDNPEDIDAVNRFIQERLDNLARRPEPVVNKSWVCQCAVGYVSCIEESLQCPVCYCVPSGQVFQCQHGHVICRGCRTRLHYCPVCRVRMQVPIRNLALEKLAKLL